MMMRALLAVVATSVVACGTSMMIADSGTSPDGSSSTDASVDSKNETSVGVDADADTGPPDCGTVADGGDASLCEQPTPCPADPAPDASRCMGELDASCGVLYRLLLECQKKYTVCNPWTCKTDLAKTGTSLQQNCASQQMAYQDCN